MIPLIKKAFLLVRGIAYENPYVRSSLWKGPVLKERSWWTPIKIAPYGVPINIFL